MAIALIFLLQNSMKVCFTLFVLFALQFFYNLILRNCTGLVVKILILVTLKFALFFYFQWSTTRVLIEVFLVLVLFENFFSIFVIATTAERRGNPYIIRCIRLINISNLLMVNEKTLSV